MKKIIKPLAVLATSAAIVVIPSFSASAAQTTANSTISANIDSTITISSAGTVNISLMPDAAGVMSSASDTVRVSTNNASGYNLALHMSTANTSLTSGSDSISQTNGSLAAPAALANNSWGYRIDGQGGFGSSSTSAEVNVANSSFTWAGVPAGGSTTNIVKSTSSTANNDQTTVWYGVRANSSLSNGNYSGTVTYTAITR